MGDNLYFEIGREFGLLPFDLKLSYKKALWLYAHIKKRERDMLKILESAIKNICFFINPKLYNEIYNKETIQVYNPFINEFIKKFKPNMSEEELNKLIGDN